MIDLRKIKEKEKLIQEFSNENNKIIEEVKKIKKEINELIKDIIENKNKIIENKKESFYLVKHPKECLFLIEIDKYNKDIYNYLKLIEIQINSHKSDRLECLYFILNNIKIISK